MASQYDIDKTSDPKGDMPDTPAIPDLTGLSLSRLGLMCIAQATDSPATGAAILDAIMAHVEQARTMDPEDVGELFGQVLWLARNSKGDVRMEAIAILSELALAQRPQDLRGKGAWDAHCLAMYDKTHGLSVEERIGLVGGA
jgi:hypothetical protein